MESVGVSTGQLGRATWVRLTALRHEPLFANAFFLWVNYAVVALSGFAFWTMAARIYSVEEVGLGSATLSAIMLLALVSHLGLGMGLVRFLPEARERGPSLVNLALSVSGLMALLASAVFIAGLPVWSPPLSYLRQQPEYAAAFALFVIAATASVILDQAFVAARSAKYLLYRNPLALLVRISLLGFFVSLGGAFSIAAATGLGALVGVFVGLTLLRRAVPSYRARLVLERGPPTFFTFTMANYIAELSLTAPGLVIPIMVVNVLGSDQAAYYYTGWLFGQMLHGVSFALALSMVAEGSRDRASLPVLSRNALAFAFPLVGAGALVMLLVGDKLLLAFGGSYSSESAGVLRLMAVAALPGVLVHLYLGIQQVRKDIGALVSLVVLVAFVALGTSYLLLPRLGIEGAGLGILAGYGSGALLALARLWREPRVTGMKTLALALFRGGNPKGEGL
ncbi:MAG: hypothetical protein A2Y61_02690 [Chloroflexi bacterium RBG_13_60_13]|nr:MAG: hypothetical protein A2Y61_02690 [Chloroflexi bacterium RBG_13_60_13]